MLWGTKFIPKVLMKFAFAFGKIDAKEVNARRLNANQIRVANACLLAEFFGYKFQKFANCGKIFSKKVNAQRLNVI